MSAARSSLGSATLPEHDFERFVAFLRVHVGLDLDQYKRRQMERRIRSFAARRGIQSLDDYAPVVAGDDDETNALLDRITINVSQLFRNPEQWQHLATEVVPDLVRTGNRRIRAWSAGCSFGAEAYSLAATVREHAPTTQLQIRASDIDRRILAVAGRGEFTEEDARTAPPLMLDRHFVPTVDGGWNASSELLRTVQFHREDLLATEPVPGAFDLVLCRNVVIYFTPEARADVHAMLAASLRPGGYLVIGSTERVAQSLDELGLELAAPFVYRKVADA